MRIVVTAGFDRARNVLGLGELLRRDGHDIVGVAVVSPFRIARLRTLARQQGTSAILRAVRRLWGVEHRETKDPIADFFTEHQIGFSSLRRWCKRFGLAYRVVPNLNSPSAVQLMEQWEPEVVIYGGGGILRTPFLNAAGRRVLNAHAGPLPEIRGMNACEWSLLLGVPPSVTIHFIDEGIDTGAIVENIRVSHEEGDTVERLRSKTVVAGMEGLRRAVQRFEARPTWRIEQPDAYRQCFVLAPALYELLERKLAMQSPAPAAKKTA
jgi:methionyl-tRNA formyltransferase